jgi:hypothetical protein
MSKKTVTLIVAVVALTLGFAMVSYANVPPPPVTLSRMTAVSVMTLAMDRSMVCVLYPEQPVPLIRTILRVLVQMVRHVCRSWQRTVTIFWSMD